MVSFDGFTSRHALDPPPTPRPKTPDAPGATHHSSELPFSDRTRAPVRACVFLARIAGVGRVVIAGDGAEVCAPVQ
jgi:hypothetical protein